MYTGDSQKTVYYMYQVIPYSMSDGSPQLDGHRNGVCTSQQYTLNYIKESLKVGLVICYCSNNWDKISGIKWEEIYGVVNRRETWWHRRGMCGRSSCDRSTSTWWLAMTLSIDSNCTTTEKLLPVLHRSAASHSQSKQQATSPVPAPGSLHFAT